MADENAGFVDDAMDTIIFGVADEMEKIMIDAEIDLIESISIPVRRNDKGIVIERSLPGQPPRREEGDLVNSIGNQVDIGVDGPDTVTGTVFTDDNEEKVVDLEGRLRRHFFGPIYNKYDPIVLARLTSLQL